jgi:hypothetical protein
MMPLTAAELSGWLLLVQVEVPCQHLLPQSLQVRLRLVPQILQRAVWTLANIMSQASRNSHQHVVPFSAQRLQVRLWLVPKNLQRAVRALTSQKRVTGDQEQTLFHDGHLGAIFHPVGEARCLNNADVARVKMGGSMSQRLQVGLRLVPQIL